MEKLAVAEARVRAAVAAESWAEAGDLLPAYVVRLETCLRDPPASARQAEELFRQARALLEFTRRMALMSRAHAAAQLTELERAGHYLPAPGRRSRWQIEG